MATFSTRTIGRGRQPAPLHVMHDRILVTNHAHPLLSQSGGCHSPFIQHCAEHSALLPQDSLDSTLLLNFTCPSSLEKVRGFGGIIEFGDTRHFEHLPFLFTVCKHMHAWLRGCKDHRVVIHCPHLPEYVSLITSCYMAYIGHQGSNNCVEAYLKLHKPGRAGSDSNSMLSLLGNGHLQGMREFQPSILRYCKFFTYCLQLPTSLTRNYSLTRIRISHLPCASWLPSIANCHPSCSWHPFIIVKQEDRVIYTTTKPQHPTLVDNKEYELAVDCQNIVGDFVLQFYLTNHCADLHRLFRCSFNTAFIQDETITLRKSHLDYACHNHAVPRTFSFSMGFEAGPVGISKEEAPSPKVEDYEEHLDRLQRSAPSHFLHDKSMRQAYRLHHITNLKHRTNTTQIMREMKEKQREMLIRSRTRALGSIYTTPKRVRQAIDRLSLMSLSQKENLAPAQFISPDTSAIKTLPVPRSVQNHGLAQSAIDRDAIQLWKEEAVKWSNHTQHETDDVLCFDDSDNEDVPSVSLSPSDSIMVLPPPPPPPPPPPIPEIPLPPPPPPPMAINQSLLPNTKRSTPLKRIFWQRIPESNLENTVWSSINMSSPATKSSVNLSQFKSLFKQQRSKPRNGGGDGPTKLPSSGRLNLLDNLTRARNIEIILQQCKLDVDTIVQMVEELDCENEKCSRNLVEQLYRHCVPSDGEVRLLQAFDGDISRLSKPDLLLWHMSQVHRVEEKLQVMLIIMDHESTVASLLQQIDIKICAAESIQLSNEFTRVLQTLLLLGNALNGRDTLASTAAFKLNVLVKIDTIRSTTDRHVSLMDCLVGALDKQGLLKSSWWKEKLEATRKAQRLSSETTKQQYAELQSALQVLERLHERTNDAHEKNKFTSQFRHHLQKFLQGARQRFCSLETQMTIYRQCVQDVVAHFGESLEDDYQHREEDFFSLIHQFLQSFSNAVQEHKKRRRKSHVDDL